jgi:hypothetical protein
VAVAFGAMGLGVNLLDLRLGDSGALRVSILAGLVFPLTVALAWGWRYGLISALAGGGQAMWWLWRGDGWGVVYAVPVFTLWIVWHGWWADRRRGHDDGRSWLRSCFLVELPFRAVVELGFYVVFPWLVWLNPPPWNPGIVRHDVPLPWVHTVAIKHTVTGYLLLLAAHVALSLQAVRRFFGLSVCPGQRVIGAIYAGALLLGAGLWALDAAVEALVYPASESFLDVLILDPNAHDVYMRVPYLALPLVAAVLLARLTRQRETLRDRLAHQNRVLSAIRNVNQLITQETDRGALLSRACRAGAGAACRAVPPVPENGGRRAARRGRGARLQQPPSGDSGLWPPGHGGDRPGKSCQGESHGTACRCGTCAGAGRPVARF